MTETKQVVALADLRPKLPDTQAAAVVMGFGSAAGFDLMQRGAKLLASSSLVPKEYQGNLPNCVIALNMANRIGADPLLVMQSLYVVHGRPSWSAQFLIATFNNCGRFAAIRYRWTGTEGKDDWCCQAISKELETGEPISGPVVSVALAKKEGWWTRSGSKWPNATQLMLMYRAAAWMVRTYAPELSMGLQTQEEAGDIYESERDQSGRYRVTQADLQTTGGMLSGTTMEQQQFTPAAVNRAQSAGPYTVDDAKAILSAATDAASLNAAWAAIMDAVPDSEVVDPTVEALYLFRKEAFEGVQS